MLRGKNFWTCHFTQHEFLRCLSPSLSLYPFVSSIYRSYSPIICYRAVVLNNLLKFIMKHLQRSSFLKNLQTKTCNFFPIFFSVILRSFTQDFDRTPPGFFCSWTWEFLSLVLMTHGRSWIRLKILLISFPWLKLWLLTKITQITISELTRIHYQNINVLKYGWVWYVSRRGSGMIYEKIYALLMLNQKFVSSLNYWKDKAHLHIMLFLTSWLKII